MPNVQAPDGSVVQFPEGMDSAAINSEMAKHFSSGTSSGPEPLEGMPSLIPSFGQGLRRPIDAAAQLLARGVEAISPSIGGPLRADTEAANRQGEADYAKTRPQSIPGSGAAETAAEIAATAPIGFAMPGASAPGLLARMGSGALTGGATGALQPVDTSATPDFWSEKAKQAGVGAAAGGIAPAVMGGISRVIQPNTSENVKTLMNAGVGLTPGQVLGGAANRVEQGMTSIPMVGDQILNARYAGVKDFNRSAINQALSPIGEKLSEDTPLGREAVAEMAQKVSDHYDALVPQLTVKADQPFQQQVSNLTNLAQFLHPDQRAQFNRTLTQQVLSKFSPNGSMTGETFKELESTLGKDARGYLNSQSYDERRLGQAYTELQGQLRDLLMRSNPGKATELQAANTAYANMLRVQGASGSIGAKDGIFTPAQLLSSVRQLDPSLRKSSFARGNALMQNFADAGKSVMSGTLPDSGTAYRLMGPALAGAGAFTQAPLATMGAAGAGLAGMGAYSPPGTAILRGLLARRPDVAGPLSEAVRSASPGASALGSRLLSLLSP